MLEFLYWFMIVVGGGLATFIVTGYTVGKLFAQGAFESVGTALMWCIITTLIWVGGSLWFSPLF